MYKFLIIVILLVIIFKLRKSSGKTIGQKIDSFNHNVRVHAMEKLSRAEESYNQSTGNFTQNISK